MADDRLKIATVMISCVQRTAARAVTVPQLVAAGYAPRVFLSPCNPAGPAENARIAGAALAWAAKRRRPVLFVEDDIDLAPDFDWHVQRAARTDTLTYLYLNDNPTRLQAHFGEEVAHAIGQRRPIRRGPYEVRAINALFGTQALVIPARLMPELLPLVRQRRRSVEPFDGELHLWAKANRSERVLVMLPHPVQHRQDRTARTPADRVMRSASFGMRTAGDVLEGTVL